MSSIRILGNRIWRRVRALVLRRAVERELDDELSFHIEMETEYHMRRGLASSDARSAALREFGALSRVKEDAREARGVRPLEDLVADVRYAARTLRGSPGFSSIALLTIAIGIGGTTAMFSLADELLLRQLPVNKPNELVFLEVARADDGPGAPGGALPYPLLQRFQEESESFSAVTAFAVDQLPFVVDGKAEQVVAQIASGNYFEMLGVRPFLGRTLRPDDERLQPAVAVISHAYWRRRFGENPAVLGTVIHNDNKPITIVGVTAPGFFGLQVGRQVEITLPITTVGEELIRDRRSSWFDVIARLKPGASTERARSEIESIYRSYEAELGARSQERQAQFHMGIDPASHGIGRLRTQLSRPITILLVLMGAVLAIACANIANLLLARGAARQRELSVRAALGASGRRIMQQMLTETLLLFAVGALGGVALATIIVRVLADFFAIGRNPILLGTDLDARALAFTAALCLLTGILAGLVPALRAARRDAFTELRVRSAGSQSLPVSRSLVVIQVAMSISILITGSSLVASLRNLRAMDPGFRSEGVLTMSVRPIAAGVPSEDGNARIWRDILARVQQLPGVQATSLSVLTPLSGRDVSRRIGVPGFAGESPADRNVRVSHISPGFFDTFGTPLRAGRSFSARDDATAPRVVIINEAAARFYFPDRNPLGARIDLGPPARPDYYEVVGVALDSKHRSLREEVPRFVYVPLAQPLFNYGRLTLALRTSGNPMSLLNTVRAEIETIDGEIVISDVMTMEQQLDQALLRERLVSALSTAFAALGLLLSAIGLYGLASFTVVRRTSEIGIRIALGATPSAIRALMLREALALVTLGLGMGAPLSLMAARAIRSLLFGVSPTDPMLVGGCIGLLAVVVGVAMYLPARRAARIDPVLTLAGK
jgi:predicted permease